MDIALSHKVSPYDHDPKATEPGEKMPDHDQWCKEGAMVRVDAEKQMDRWKACNGCDT